MFWVLLYLFIGLLVTLFFYNKYWKHLEYDTGYRDNEIWCWGSTIILWPIALGVNLIDLFTL